MGHESGPGWEYRAVFLGGGQRSEATIAALAREGWELTHVAAPHHGTLTLIGHFRRRRPRTPPCGGKSAAPDAERPEPGDFTLGAAGLCLLLGGGLLGGWPALAAAQGGLGLVLAGALLHALRAAGVGRHHP
jgi:hypothetical protein